MLFCRSFLHEGVFCDANMGVVRTELATPFYSCTVQPKRWARYGLADIFGGPKVLDSKIIVYLRNFGEKIIALAKFML